MVLNSISPEVMDWEQLRGLILVKSSSCSSLCFCSLQRLAITGEKPRGSFTLYKQQYAYDRYK